MTRKPTASAFMVLLSLVTKWSDDIVKEVVLISYCQLAIHLWETDDTNNIIKEKGSVFILYIRLSNLLLMKLANRLWFNKVESLRVQRIFSKDNLHRKSTAVY